MVTSPAWLEDIRELAMEHTRISPMMVHRRLPIPRKAAEALLRELERQGVVGPPMGDGTREVLKHVARLWGFPVHLESVNQGGDVRQQWTVVPSTMD